MKLIRFITIVIFSFLSMTIAVCQASFPEVSLVDIEGKSVDMQSIMTNGKPKLVSLWATWCGPCRMELNSLKSPYVKWEEKYGLEILTVSVDVPQMVDRAKKMFKDNQWSYTFLHDANQELMNELNLTGIPYSMLIDGSGKIITVQVGYTPGYEKNIEHHLKSM